MMRLLYSKRKQITCAAAFVCFYTDDHINTTTINKLILTPHHHLKIAHKSCPDRCKASALDLLLKFICFSVSMK